MEIYDLNEKMLSDRNGMYGGNSGDKEGILIDGERWLVKYPKNTRGLSVEMEDSYNTAPVSEYLGSHIYGILGYDVHDTILGVRNGHLVVACKDMCDDSHFLVEFRQLKNVYNRELNEKLDESFESTRSSEHFTSLKAIMLHLEYNPAFYNIDGICERFWDCVVVDGLINNNDRNSGNWGLLRGKDGDRLAPVYDNGAAFSPNIPESKLEKRLNDKNVAVQSICSVKTAYSLDGKKNAFFGELLKTGIPGLQDAVMRVVPKIKEHEEAIKSLINDIPEEDRGIKIMSPLRRSEYLMEIDIRYQDMLLPCYERIAMERMTELKRDMDMLGIPMEAEEKADGLAIMVSGLDDSVTEERDVSEDVREHDNEPDQEDREDL